MGVWLQLLRLDKNINADVFNGDRAETMSERMGENILEKDYGCCKWKVAVCKILSWLDPRKGNHCIESIE